MRYQATVMNAAMQVESIAVNASNEEEARHMAAATGRRLLALRKEGLRLRRPARAGSLNLTVFNQQLNSLLAAGQNISDAIEILGRNDKSARHRSIYDALLQALRHGKQLSAAMADLPSVFPGLYVAMVRASETTGTVQLSIKRFMQYQRQTDEIRAKIKSAAIYPMILLVVGFAVVSFLMLYVLPRFSAIFDGSTARGASAGFVQAWGGFVRANTFVAWSGFAALGAGLAGLLLHQDLRAWAGRTLLRLPWLGERIWILQLSRLYRTLSMLMRSGVPVLTAMRMTEAALPVAMRAPLSKAIGAVSEGLSLSEVLSEHGLSTQVSQRLLLAGESSGNLDAMMEHIADFHDQEVAAWIDTASRLIEPILMVGIGLVIGAIVLMLYTPIFELSNIS
jgi:general secretion pathway protein F